MITADATLRSPVGFLAAIQAKAQRLGFSHEQLLARANVTPEEWSALDAALSAADDAVFRRLQNAVRSQACLATQTAQVLEAPDGRATSDSYGPQWTSHFGDLG